METEKDNKLFVSWPLMRALMFFGPVLFITSCNNQQETQRKLDDLSAYVHQQGDSIDAYADRANDKIDSTFESKRIALDKDTAQMNQQMRDKYYQTVNDWNTFKTNLATKTREKNKVHEMDQVRASLGLSGVRDDFSDLQAADIVKAYEHFVQVVKEQKDNYSKEQWLVVNISYKNLNGRKKELGKDIKSADNDKIAKLQIEYTAIKAVNRPEARSENE